MIRLLCVILVGSPAHAGPAPFGPAAPSGLAAKERPLAPDGGQPGAAGDEAAIIRDMELLQTLDLLKLYPLLAPP